MHIPENELIIASNNPGKVREIADLLMPFSLAVFPASAYGLPEPEETGTTFAANAEIKALAAMEATKMPALADDSGLAVDALDGAPGIYSARWAGPEKDFSMAMTRIEQALKDKNVAPEEWTASFICDLCLCLPDGSMQHFEGRVNGLLTFPARGDHGFGYDPIFIPEGKTQTFAEMPAGEKATLSHRSRAFAKFESALSA